MLTVRCETGYEYQVTGRVAENLVGDMQVSVFRVADLGRSGHGSK
jgi:hypothetical protein